MPRKSSSRCPQCGEPMVESNHQDVCKSEGCGMVAVHRCPLCKRFEAYDIEGKVIEVKSGYQHEGPPKTRVRRGKIVVIPMEWRGRTTHPQTIRKRKEEARFRRRAPNPKYKVAPTVAEFDEVIEL